MKFKNSDNISHDQANPYLPLNANYGVNIDY